MAQFIRTTGGLLQLKPKQATKKDYDRLVKFALTLGDESILKSVQTPSASKVQPRSKSVQFVVEPKKKPMDLQADMPEVFR